MVRLHLVCGVAFLFAFLTGAHGQPVKDQELEEAMMTKLQDLQRLRDGNTSTVLLSLPLILPVFPFSSVSRVIHHHHLCLCPCALVMCVLSLRSVKNLCMSRPRRSVFCAYLCVVWNRAIGPPVFRVLCLLHDLTQHASSASPQEGLSIMQARHVKVIL